MEDMVASPPSKYEAKCSRRSPPSKVEADERETTVLAVVEAVGACSRAAFRLQDPPFPSKSRAFGHAQTAFSTASQLILPAPDLKGRRLIHPSDDSTEIISAIAQLMMR